MAAVPNEAQAQVDVSTTTTFYMERGGGLSSTIVAPNLRVQGTVADRVNIRAGYDADIVSGASVAVVDAPGDVDAITSATQLSDVRHTASAGLGLIADRTRLDVDYSYGHESDYRSHGLRLRATAELFERNTRFELSYGRGFDRVCNLAHGRNVEAVDRGRLPSSDGCFESDDRQSESIDLQTFQGAWSQNWTSIFATQLTLSAQLQHGYLGNPYRGVWLGRSAAQEHHPENRARYAAGLALRLWLEPVAGALQLQGRIYRDSWDILSGTAELAYEQRLGRALRLRARARYYTQSGAAFYSDNYVLQPRGQYFTGDRELSPMSSTVFGAQLAYDVPPGDDGQVAFLDSLKLLVKVDWLRYDFSEFRYGRVEVPNDWGLMATFSLQAQM